MTGTIQKVIGGSYYFILGDDGITYFCPMGRTLRKYIWKGNTISFNSVQEKGQEHPKAINAVPTKQKNPKYLQKELPVNDGRYTEYGDEEAKICKESTDVKFGTISGIHMEYNLTKCFFIIKGYDSIEYFAPCLNVIHYTENRKKIVPDTPVKFITLEPYKNKENERMVAQYIVLLKKKE